MDPALHHRAGSTPACAGSTGTRSTARPGRWVYPRLRGEHTLHPNHPDAGTGLPPPARGARYWSFRYRARARSTPACAGSTVVPAEPEPMTWVYPRLRGEHHSPSQWKGCSSGLPPPARGAPVGAVLHVARFRSTPACAGSTLPSNLRLLLQLQHRGNRYGVCSGASEAGSMRGIQLEIRRPSRSTIRRRGEPRT